MTLQCDRPILKSSNVVSFNSVVDRRRTMLDEEVNGSVRAKLSLGQHVVDQKFFPEGNGRRS